MRPGRLRVTIRLALLLIALISAFLWAGIEGPKLLERYRRAQAMKAALNRPIEMPFANPTPLADALNYVAVATQSPEMPDGLPLYLDAIAMRKAGWTPQIVCARASVPLKDALSEILNPLGLSYTVRDEFVLISGL